MLVYFDPWLAGVVLPSLIIVGLMAIPYIDTNPKGNGYFTFKERKWEITIFLFGFLVLWCVLIVLGTFLRGPNWNFFGPYEFWDVNKLVPLNNINLSEIIWIKLLQASRCRTSGSCARSSASRSSASTSRCCRSLLSKTLLRRFYEKMGTVRYMIGVSLAPDDAGAADQDVPALDLQPEVHRHDPRVLVQHLSLTPCPASRPPSRSITTTTSRG